ncbi:MAG TPA: glycosyltransferase family 4 protein [Bacteroidia bacterium]|nr:glycosyltransferase family 4 protein [Sphingobacteriales bacterium]HPD66296.1 glycosyltransferase family 4 protein [Bacteroidia bacterium]HRS58190.1 glycosyltransferase family 4 protein [Bacteroidia bacterium]HRU69267.1 glycosyltransferase family 4 protein [Bacteroidia bacterium]
MRVLMFGWEFPPFISGGLGTASHGIAKGLVNNGVQLTFVLPTRRGLQGDDKFKIIAADEVHKIERYSKVIQALSTISKKEIKKEFTIAPYFTSEDYVEYFTTNHDVVTLKKIIKSNKGLLHFTGNYGKDLLDEVYRYGIIGEILGFGNDFDIIHAHDWLTYYAGVAAKRSSGKPLVIHVHATEFDRSGEHVNQTVYDIERFGMENADKIIAVSYYTKNIIVSRYGIAPEKVEVVHNAVDKTRKLEAFGLKKKEGEKIVLFMGRITMQKGPDYFVEAAYRVYRKNKNVRFVMAGTGDMLPRMILRMAKLRMLDRFHFTGFLKGLDVERMYAMSDVYVMPSVSEPFGIAPFEALLYDVPIIISKQSGISEVLPHALKIDFWDINKMAELILLLIENEQIAKDIADKCKDDMKNIGWDNAGNKIKQIYESIKS